MFSVTRVTYVGGWAEIATYKYAVLSENPTTSGRNAGPNINMWLQMFKSAGWFNTVLKMIDNKVLSQRLHMQTHSP